MAVLAAACDGGEVELAKGSGTAGPMQFTTAAEYAALMAADPEALCLSGSVQVDLTEPGQAVGYVVTAGKGAKLTVETSGSPDLDTVVFLYGPGDGAGFFGEWPVAMDDDGGEGLLSLIDSHSLKSAGSYAVIVTTFGGNSLGLVTLSVAVDGQAGCQVSAPTCDDGDPCTVDAADAAGVCTYVPAPECGGGADICDGLDNDGDGLVDEDCKGCQTDSDCGGGQTCDPAIGLCGCAATCVSDADCGPGSVCTIDAAGCTSCGPACIDANGDGICDDTNPCVDLDGDGLCTDIDCDDTNPAAFPGAPEVCDGLDDNCDGVIDEGCSPCPDANGDGICDGDECPDANLNGLCDGDECPDVDLDGSCDDVDCDPADPSVGPGLPEICNGLDDDCDGEVDETCAPCEDANGDGLCDPEECIDADGDGICDDVPCPDQDGDGVCDVDDCDPTNSGPSPELCNGLDDDCDGLVDEDCAPGTCFVDSDCPAGQLCDPATGQCTCADTCVSDADCAPGDVCTFDPNGCTMCAPPCGELPEICNGLDDNCDGVVDEDCGCEDADGDGSCVAEDCDDQDPAIAPFAPEMCNGLDDDCDGLVDDDCAP